MNLNLWSKQLSVYFPCLLFEVISKAADLYMYSYRHIYIYIFYYLGEGFRNVSANVSVSSDRMWVLLSLTAIVSHGKRVPCPDQLIEPCGRRARQVPGLLLQNQVQYTMIPKFLYC